MYAPVLLATWGSILLAPVWGAVTWDAAPFNPPAVPLAVRTPYLSAWLAQGSGTALNAGWPTFWTGSVLGWAGYVKVDGKTYNWLGAPTVAGADKAIQKSFKFTSTQSTFVLTAGPVDLTVNFLSPVEPSDLVNQSLPFSYYAVSVASNDDQAHSVQVYTDISAEWVTGDNNLKANWTTTTGEVLAHQVQLENQSVYNEINDHIQHGSAYHAILNTQGVTWQSGADSVVRAQFINNGKLANTADTEFRAVSDRWPVFALAHDFGSVTGPSEPAVFVVGHVRDPVIQYIIQNNSLQDRSSYFWTKFPSVAGAISTFINDYQNAVARASAFDVQVRGDAEKISSDYADIVELSVRQAFAAIETTVSKTGSRDFNTTDVLTFMKEISSNGNMNTIDVIFPAWPIFLYTSPLIGKLLLLPHYEYQASGQYPNKWALHDIGAHYPQAHGHNDGNDEPMQVEESGNQLIMALSYTRKSGDRSLIETYYNLLDQWAQFLIEDSLIPELQLSTDDFAGRLANQTNLAIKGIIGIKAMAEIAAIVGDNEKANNYSAIATSYVEQWQDLALAENGQHLTLSYNDHGSWGLAYNLYADKLLKFDLFPETIYDLQTAWYSTHANTYGVPLDTRHTYTKTDWEIWTAALVTSTEVRDLLIGSVRKFAADGLSSQPFGDWYETTNGRPEGFRARPVAGGHLAFLALE
ncbi:DUF1793-domain-containing protein [Fomes fomentarius]|nr:DUF1793-domain-containing protein [Fomes fomentarius]